MEINSIQLISNNISYGPLPAPTEEVEQHLTISSSGHIWFSARNIEQWEAGKGFCRKEQLNIGTWKAQFLLNLIDKIDINILSVDCGDYELFVRYQDGRKRRTFGPLIEDITVPSYGKKPVSITRLMRRYIPIHDLFGFNEDLETDYAGKKAIFSFSQSWAKRFASQELTKREFEESFGEECISLGFQMDCGNEFITLYPHCFNIKSSEVDSVIKSIQDVDLLGSAVLSQWRYLTHWAYSYELDTVTCHWFDTILKQMRHLSKLKKRRIIID